MPFYQIPQSPNALTDPPFPAYVALLTQAGAADPVAVVVVNTTGTNIVWTRTSAGTYIATAASPIFVANKTGIEFGPANTFSNTPSNVTNSINVLRLSTTVISVNTMFVEANTGIGGPIDNRLTETKVEIILYP